MLNVLSFLESLKAWRRLQWGIFFIGSLLYPKKDKSIHRRARPSCRGWENSLPLVVQLRQKRLNLYWLEGYSDTFMSMNETKFARQYFLDEKAGKELNDNPCWAFLKVRPLYPRKHKSMQRGMVLAWMCQGGPFHMVVYIVHKRRYHKGTQFS